MAASWIFTASRLPGVPRGEKVQALISERYGDLDQLWGLSLDAVVVTGAEPQKAELTEEPYWPALEALLWLGQRGCPEHARLLPERTRRRCGASTVYLVGCCSKNAAASSLRWLTRSTR